MRASDASLGAGGAEPSGQAGILIVSGAGGRHPRLLPLGNLEPLPPPEPLDHQQADLSAGLPQQRIDAAVAISTIILRKGDDGGRQPLLVGIVLRRMTPGRAVLAEHLAGPPFRHW